MLFVQKNDKMRAATTPNEKIDWLKKLADDERQTLVLAEHSAASPYKVFPGPQHPTV